MTDKILDYRNIHTDDIDQLDSIVAELLKQSWQPVGSMVVVQARDNTESHEFVQTMVNTVSHR